MGKKRRLRANNPKFSKKVADQNKNASVEPKSKFSDWSKKWVTLKT